MSELDRTPCIKIFYNSTPASSNQEIRIFEAEREVGSLVKSTSTVYLLEMKEKAFATATVTLLGGTL